MRFYPIFYSVPQKRVVIAQNDILSHVYILQGKAVIHREVTPENVKHSSTEVRQVEKPYRKTAKADRLAVPFILH